MAVGVIKITSSESPVVKALLLNKFPSINKDLFKFSYTTIAIQRHLKVLGIFSRLAIGFERMPALERAGIKNIVNGPFTFGPDGSPLIGPVPGMKNYWVAVGVMAGFCQG